MLAAALAFSCSSSSCAGDDAGGDEAAAAAAEGRECLGLGRLSAWRLVMDSNSALEAIPVSSRALS